MKKPLKDPYSSTKVEKDKIQTWLPLAEKLFLQGINPLRGTAQSTINLLLKGLLDECRELGITSYDRIDDFIELVHRRSSPTFPLDHARVKTPERDDRGGKEDLGEKTSRSQNERAESPKSNRQKRSGAEGEKRKRS
jgi:hypothetical protein